MAQEVIGIGSAANDGTGDPLRTAINKVNLNFTEVYNVLLPAKADASAMTTALAAKANSADVTTALSAKADASALTSGLAAKVDSSTLTETVQDMIGTFLVAGANVTLTYNDAGNALTIAATGGGGGGTPGGADTQLQFNDGGVFGGDAGFTFNKTNKAVVLGGATVTTNNPVLTLTQTWNAGAVAFSAIALTVTNTASATTSKLIDLKVGASAVFYVDYLGTMWSANFVRGQRLQVQQNGIFYGTFDTGGIVLPTTSAFMWTDSGVTDYSGSGVTRMYRDANHAVALRNGVNAYTLRIYETESSSLVNYSRLSISAAATGHIIKAEAAGTGVVRPIFWKYHTNAADPTTTDVPAGHVVFWQKTGEAVKLWANNGGVMVSVPLA